MNGTAGFIVLMAANNRAQSGDGSTEIPTDLATAFVILCVVIIGALAALFWSVERDLRRK